jgi:hypothetical protein
MGPLCGGPGRKAAQSLPFQGGIFFARPKITLLRKGFIYAMLRQ